MELTGKRTGITRLERKRFLSPYPPVFLKALEDAASEWKDNVYISGGSVRDFLLGKRSNDLDLTVPENSHGFCSLLCRKLGGGTFVPLSGRKEEDAGRLVWKGITLDVTGFRDGATTIDADLGKRDFTMNSMAVLFGDDTVIDPYNGKRDLERGVLCPLPDSFLADPLRMLRGYRLQAVHGFDMDPGCHSEIKTHAAEIASVSRERISHELDLIMEAENSHRSLMEMYEDGLLFLLFPELKETEGVMQPDFHHLDVFGHSLEAVRQLENIYHSPEKYFPSEAALIAGCLENKKRRRRIKWAALFHDLGKPSAMAGGESQGTRVTFHNHDRMGKELFCTLADRFRWSRKDRQKTAELILYHMHPFFLANLLREGKLTDRAVIRLARRAGQQLADLFCLAMSDSLASRGRLKPEKMESGLAHLFGISYDHYLQRIRPVFSRKRYLDGRDLIEVFGLKPGPVFKEIFDELELLTMEGKIRSRQEARDWFARNRKCFLSY